jgi:hypothetical protein
MSRPVSWRHARELERSVAERLRPASVLRTCAGQGRCGRVGVRIGVIVGGVAVSRLADGPFALGPGFRRGDERNNRRIVGVRKANRTYGT